METKSNYRWSADDDHMQRNVVRKITFRLMPILVLGLFFSYVDRANLGILFGPLSRDLHLTAADFGLAAGLFYIGYLLFEIPSNMGLVKFGARRWIARIMVTWGLVTAALALTQGATSLYALRILLGIAEAGFFPGVIYLLTLWYPPSVHARAYSTLQMSMCISLSLGAVLTSGLLVLDGTGGLAGWQWVFILEGVSATLLGVYIFFAMPDNPEKAKWLSRKEKDYLRVAVSARHDASEHSHAGLSGVLKQKGMWLLTLLYFTIVIGFWTVTYFLPHIVQERFHVGSVRAGLISAIPFVVAAVSTAIVNWSATRSGDRKWHMFILLCIAGVGLILTSTTTSPLLALIGLCMAAMGSQSSVPLFWSMPSNWYAGPAAAVAIALINSLGNVGGLAGPWILGVLTDITGDTRMGLLVMSGFFLFSAVLAFLLGGSSAHGSHAKSEPVDSLAEKNFSA